MGTDHYLGQLQRTPQLGLGSKDHRLVQYIHKGQVGDQLPALGIDAQMLDQPLSQLPGQIGNIIAEQFAKCFQLNSPHISSM